MAPALLVLAACAGPRVESAEGLLETAWRAGRVAEREGARPAAEAVPQAPSAGEEGPEPAAWTLEDVLGRVARASPDLAVAQARLDEAEAHVRAARARALPELSLGLDYVATDSPSRAFGLLLDQEELTLGPGFDPTPGTVENWRKEVRVDWALVEPGRGETRRSAREAEEAAGLEREALERRLLNAALQAWLGLRATRARAAVFRESVVVVERRLEETRRRYDEGAALRADVLRLEVRLAAARGDAARAGLGVREAESALDELMGREADAPLPLADEEVAVGRGLPDDLEALIAEAAAGRRDLLAAAHDVRRVAFERRASRSERYPSLQAFAAYDVDGEDPGIDADLDSYVAGVGLRFPLSARTGARIRAAEARERLARERLRALTLSVAREVRDAREALAVAREDLALAEASVGAAEEAFRIVAEAQDAGAATVTDVLEAEDSRRRARVRLVSARAGVEIARARLVGAVGGVR